MELIHNHTKSIDGEAPTYRNFRLVGRHLLPETTITVAEDLNTGEGFTWIASSNGASIVIHPDGYTSRVFGWQSAEDAHDRYGRQIGRLCEFIASNEVVAYEIY